MFTNFVAVVNTSISTFVKKMSQLISAPETKLLIKCFNKEYIKHGRM